MSSQSLLCNQPALSDVFDETQNGDPLVVFSNRRAPLLFRL